MAGRKKSMAAVRAVRGQAGAHYAPAIQLMREGRSLLEAATQTAVSSEGLYQWLRSHPQPDVTTHRPRPKPTVKRSARASRARYSETQRSSRTLAIEAAIRADPSVRNIDLATQHGVTHERVRQIRRRIGAETSSNDSRLPAAMPMVRQFADAHGLTPYQVTRRALEFAGVLPVPADLRPLQSGSDLRAARAELGWSQGRLARELDVAEYTVLRWEQDHLRPDWLRLTLHLRLLGLHAPANHLEEES